MYNAPDILTTVADLIHIMLMIYLIIVIIGALISWVNPDPYNPVVQFLRRATHPVFFWLRQRIPLIFGGIDLSPIAVITIIIFLDYAIVRSLKQHGNIVANTLLGIGYSISSLLYFYMWIVIIATFITFVNPNQYNPIVRFLYGITEPVFSWFRRRLPLRMGGLDFSPFLVVIIIILINYLINRALH